MFPQKGKRLKRYVLDLNNQHKHLNEFTGLRLHKHAFLTFPMLLPPSSANPNDNYLI